MLFPAHGGVRRTRTYEQRFFHKGNRERLYAQLQENSLLVLFAGVEVRKTNDEFYPFYTNRNFLYLTGLDQKELALIARKDGQGQVAEKVYILPPDWMAERWTGTRIKPNEATDLSGIQEIGYVADFEGDLHKLATSGNYQHLYLDLYRVSPTDRDEPAHLLLRRVASDYPFLRVENANALIRRMRTIKQPCELEAMRKAEEITCAGITSMMKASKPGMYEYQYKAVFDYAIGQYGPQGPGFPSIISAGKNNFCIHYYSYKGQAHDGAHGLKRRGRLAQLCDDRRLPGLALQRQVQRAADPAVQHRPGDIQPHVLHHQARHGHEGCGRGIPPVLRPAFEGRRGCWTT